MGRGSNRKTKLSRQRTSWRKNKARIRKAHEEGLAGAKRKPGTTADVKKKTTTTAPGKATVTRRTT